MGIAVVLLTNCGNMSGSNSSSDQSRNTAPEATPTYSLEYQLAAIQGGDLSDETVGRYKDALDRLQGRCPDSRTHLGDMTVKSQEILKQHAVNVESLLSILIHVYDLIPDQHSGSCSDVFALYLSVRKGVEAK
ncbi:MAG: hypothetical protein ACYDCC_16165 [Actinomycetota bacterium]